MNQAELLSAMGPGIVVILLLLILYGLARWDAYWRAKDNDRRHH